MTHPEQDIHCSKCQSNSQLGFDISMAYQPIVDVGKKKIFSFEALVRGVHEESAGDILSQVNPQNRFAFDQLCRTKAISLAAEQNLDRFLNINFMPNAIYEPRHCIESTLNAADRFNFPYTNIIFEMTEGEPFRDHKHLENIFTCYKDIGFKTAIDDFGAGYAGLNLLADFQPDLIKLDMALIRNVHQDAKRQAIVEGIHYVCRKLDIDVIAEGVETYDEFSTLYKIGIRLFQGFYFKKPQFQTICNDNDITWGEIPA
ncbi:MAG: diguanylate phosphodiesterase [Nitrospinae bacterium CG11_big_fil_rev_8_21_14_0_20_45_15]|nr:MAG: diguanylate phosphodiesterase [Nitrospinae bacterium CG11_big_fil_rev_8_21_14_0_20_45_15]